VKQDHKLKKVNVDLTNNSYQVFIGNSNIAALKETILKYNLYKKLLVIIDEGVEEFHFEKIKEIFSKGFNKVLFYTLKKGEEVNHIKS